MLLPILWGEFVDNAEEFFFGPYDVIADWQHPFVNVFKLCGADKWTDVERIGNVKDKMVRQPRLRKRFVTSMTCIIA